MRFRNETVFSFFSSIKSQLIIPDYQRAFSWEDDEHTAFFNDLYEQSKSENNYFFGNILVEESKDSSKAEIVDGQQRLTTIVIFIRSLINVLEEQKILDHKDFDIEEMKRAFLQYNEKAKLVVSKIDQEYFENVILKNGKANVKSKSQERMKKTKQYFTKKIKSVKSVAELKKIYEKLQNSILTITIIDNKIDSTFMFELQNNRGRDITAMEQTKAYLMYQIYVNETSPNIDSTIEGISELFGEIYLFLNDININEDDLLWYHCQAYNGYNFIDDNYETVVEFLKDSLSQTSQNEEKVKYIKKFVLELKKTFSNIYEMEKNNTCEYLRRLKLLGIDGNLYPLIINGYRFMDKNDTQYLDKLFHICELLAFRLSIIPSHGNMKIKNRLDGVLNFEGNLKVLYNDIKQKFVVDDWRWTDDAMEEVLNGDIYNRVRNGVIHYIFKIYEHKKTGKYPKLTKISIEHISPQTPPKVPNSGYQLTKKYEYSKAFHGKYLHCLGNLMLSTEKQQYILFNYTFSEKYKIYKGNDLELLHQKEVDKFFEDPKKVKWEIPEIENRRSHLIKVIMDEWSFKSNDKKFL